MFCFLVASIIPRGGWVVNRKVSRLEEATNKKATEWWLPSRGPLEGKLHLLVFAPTFSHYEGFNNGIA